MRIDHKVSQSRRDFTAVYVCEHCGHTLEGNGYDDAYFHGTVIPEMVCPVCGRAGAGQSSWPNVPEGVVL